MLPYAIWTNLAATAPLYGERKRGCVMGLLQAEQLSRVRSPGN